MPYIGSYILCDYIVLQKIKVDNAKDIRLRISTLLTSDFIHHVYDAVKTRGKSSNIASENQRY